MSACSTTSVTAGPQTQQLTGGLAREAITVEEFFHLKANQGEVS